MLAFGSVSLPAIRRRKEGTRFLYKLGFWVFFCRFFVQICSSTKGTDHGASQEEENLRGDSNITIDRTTDHALPDHRSNLSRIVQEINRIFSTSFILLWWIRANSIWVLWLLWKVAKLLRGSVRENLSLPASQVPPEDILSLSDVPSKVSMFSNKHTEEQTVYMKDEAAYQMCPLVDPLLLPRFGKERTYPTVPVCYVVSLQKIHLLLRNQLWLHFLTLRSQRQLSGNINTFNPA